MSASKSDAVATSVKMIFQLYREWIGKQEHIGGAISTLMILTSS